MHIIYWNKNIFEVPIIKGTKKYFTLQSVKYKTLIHT